MINEIFNEGFADFFIECRSERNPYPEDSEEYLSWEAGFAAAELDLDLFFENIKKLSENVVEE